MGKKADTISFPPEMQHEGMAEALLAYSLKWAFGENARVVEIKGPDPYTRWLKQTLGAEVEHFPDEFPLLTVPSESLAILDRSSLVASEKYLRLEIQDQLRTE